MGRPAGSLDIWFSPSIRRDATIPNHPDDMPGGTLHAILRQAGVEAGNVLNT